MNHALKCIIFLDFLKRLPNVRECLNFTLKSFGNKILYHLFKF